MFLRGKPKCYPELNHAPIFHQGRKPVAFERIIDEWFPPGARATLNVLKKLGVESCVDEILYIDMVGHFQR